MYCPNCKADLVSDAVSCTGCGAVFGADAAWKPVLDPSAKPVPDSSPGFNWKWLLVGAIYGVAARVLYGALPAGFHGAMSAAFLLGTPFVVGALSVYGTAAARPGVFQMLVTPLLPTVLMLFGTAITLLEGSICIAIMAPLFLGIASFGGLCMGLTLKFFRVSKSGINAFAALPLLLLVHDQIPLPDTFHELRETIVINAPAHVVWSKIVTAQDIKADELPLSIVHLIGVPKPVQAINKQTPQGEVRFSQWDKGVRFSALVVDRRQFQTITWRYKFDQDSFPPGTMDEHVVIGGKYLDLGDTTFNLSPTAGGDTKLAVVARYRLSTSINFYAGPVSRILGQDFLRTLLCFYKQRSERANSGTTNPGG